ncbi:MAG: capsule biosynthesis protein [Roseobacter sp.]|jgi:capsular polysaccharide transport system permease protein
MTTKPTARKFRIRRSSSSAAADGTAEPGQTAVNDDAVRPESRDPAPQQPKVPGNAALEIDAIRREGLTGRQLRMARRVAQKNGLAPTSDFDAVRLLRQRGIDPFKRTNMLELVVPRDQAKSADGEDGTSARVQLPQTIPSDQENLPSTNLSPMERRSRQISEIQQDIARRRRRKVRMLLLRLMFFVFLPTMLAGYYFFAMASPMYATKSEFLILQADSTGGSAMGGLLSGTQFATSQDSIAVQSYLHSKDAMLRLDGDVGFKSHFTQGFIDPLQRLSENPTNEEAYKTYKKNVKVGYDPTEGVLRMEVIAADPQTSKEFSQALIDYAEERVNGLSEQKRDDQMAEAEESFEKAVAERRAAQEALVKLQLEGATLDPEAVIAGLRTQINNVETLLLEKDLQLAALLDNTRPNQSRVDGVRGDIRRLNEQLDELNARMTDASQGENSLAQLSVRIQMAQADLATRDMLLQSALQQMEQTRMEANRQVRYLTTSVEPVAPQEPSYPRSFENTILAFLIFAGIYLMVSLTVSILREQVTS